MIEPDERPVPRPPASAPYRTARKPIRVDRELWWHCTESCVVVAIAIWLSAALLPPHSPLWAMAGGLGVLTGVVWWVALTVTGAGPLASWLLAWGVALTGWFTWARLAGAWSSEVISALVFAVIILTPLGPPAIGHYRARGGRDAEAEDKSRQRKELAKWETLFANLGIKGVQVTQVFRHDNGLQVYGRLGKATDAHGMATFDKIKVLAPEIATHFRLSRDAAYFEEGETAADFTLHLRTRRGKRQVVYLPEITGPTSINKALGLGQHDNGRSFRMLLREIAVIIVGVIGAGKSNLLNVFIGDLAPCEDALVFVIDLKGGRMARPWIMPWIEDPDGVRRPVIDWLATTRAEAMLMLDTLILAGDARAHQGAGGEKVTPRRDLPAVVLIMDETAVATGHDRKDEDISARKLAVKLAQVVETYRSEAFVPIVAAVRGDVETMGLTAVKAMSLARIGLRVSQATDGDSVFPDDHAAALALAKITDDGAGLALLKGKISAPVHFYRMTPKIAYKIARRTGPWRPEPDSHLRAAMGDAYEHRWDRMKDLLDQWHDNAAQWREEAGIGPLADLDKPEAAPAGEDPAPRPPRSTEDELFREIVAAIEDPEGKVHPARHRMRELLFQAGKDGYTVGEMLKILASEAQQTGNPELAVHRNTLHNWLRADEEAGRVRRRGGLRGDPYARWTWIRTRSDDGIIDGTIPREDDGEEWGP
jgi:hypothetical protein